MMKPPPVLSNLLKLRRTYPLWRDASPRERVDIVFARSRTRSQLRALRGLRAREKRVLLSA